MFLNSEGKLILLFKFLWWDFIYSLRNRNNKSLERTRHSSWRWLVTVLRGSETSFDLNSSRNTVGVMKQENIIWVEHLL